MDWEEFWEDSKYGKLIVGFVSLVILIIVIIVPMSFAPVEYYEMGFVKSKTTGKVDTSQVYTSGLHFIGPAHTFKKFRCDVQFESFKNVAIFNKEKIEVEFSFSMLYKLRPEYLKNLHDDYNLDYHSVFRTKALSSLKGAATQFTVDEYRLEREKIKTAFGQELSQALGGNCCRKSKCKEDTMICKETCKDLSKCTELELGLYADLHYFHLHKIHITRQQEALYLKKVLEQEKEDTEKFKQIEAMTSIETDKMRDDIYNQAEEISQTAIAESGFIKANAAIESSSKTADAANSGLQIIYAKLNITKETHKKNLDYVRTLSNSEDARLYVGFEYMVANP